MYPATVQISEVVLNARQAIRACIHGQDRKRLVVIVGPCSIHETASALEYAEKVKAVAEQTQNELVIVMRTYFEKPRTTVGWKGLINDPNLDGSCDIASGVKQARELLIQINTLGVPCASELLDPVVPQYISDLLSWVAIGARTTESQTHRQMASGLSMPVGFKNGTDGGLEVALHAMISASHPHSFLGINMDGQTVVLKTTGNPDRHIVLRGGSNGPNYSSADIERAAQLLAADPIVRPILVDCSHGNSKKDFTRQGEACREVLKQVRSGQEKILGISLESHLQPGRQDWKPGQPLKKGTSITDACIGWEETAQLLFEMAEAVRSRTIVAHA